MSEHQYRITGWIDRLTESACWRFKSAVDEFHISVPMYCATQSLMIAKLADEVRKQAQRLAENEFGGREDVTPMEVAARADEIMDVLWEEMSCQISVLSGI